MVSSYAVMAESRPQVLPTMQPRNNILPVPVGNRANRVLRVRAATFPRRFLAAVLDVLLVTVITLVVSAIATLVLGIRLPTAKELGPDFILAGIFDRNPMVLGSLGIFIGISSLYQTYLGGILGQTVGKRLMRLRVITTRGQSPGPVCAVLRTAWLLLSLAPAGLGFLWCIFDRERRSLHDHLAGTYVIFDEP